MVKGEFAASLKYSQPSRPKLSGATIMKGTLTGAVAWNEVHFERPFPRVLRLILMLVGMPRAVKADAFYRMFRALADRTDLEYAMLDGSIVKVRRAGQGAEGGLNARP